MRVRLRAYGDEMWGDMGRYGEIWGDMGRGWERLRAYDEMRRDFPLPVSKDPMRSTAEHSEHIAWRHRLRDRAAPDLECGECSPNAAEHASSRVLVGTWDLITLPGCVAAQ